MISKHLRLVAGLCFVPFSVAAQGGVPSAAGATPSTSAPIYVLYRFFLRDIAAMDAAAAKSDAAGKPGGDQARRWYQDTLLLTDAEALVLKQSARQCNQSLDQFQQTTMQPVIAAVQAQKIPYSASAPPAQLVALEQQRTAISNTCIQNLHAAMGDRKFMDIDVFVRSKFAQHVSPLPPPNTPITAGSVTRMGGSN